MYSNAMKDAALKRQRCERLAREIANSLAHHTLLLADGLLDEARRFAMMSKYWGAADEAVIGELQTPPEAVGIGARYIGLSIDDVLAIDRLVRLALWVAHFAAQPKTKFGAGYASALEEARRYEHAPDGKGKLN